MPHFDLRAQQPIESCRTIKILLSPIFAIRFCDVRQRARFGDAKLDLTKYAPHHWWGHYFQHLVSCEQAPGCHPKLSKAVQSRPELPRPLPNLSSPSRAFQIHSRAASSAPSKASPKPCQGPHRALQSPPELPRHAQNRPEPTPELPKAFQNKPKPSTDLRSQPRTFPNMPKQIGIVYL